MLPVRKMRTASDTTTDCWLSELAAAASLLGFDALGVADLNSLAGVVRMHAAARTAGTIVGTVALPELTGEYRP